MPSSCANAHLGVCDWGPFGRNVEDALGIFARLIAVS